MAKVLFDFSQIEEHIIEGPDDRKGAEKDATIQWRVPSILERNPKQTIALSRVGKAMQAAGAAEKKAVDGDLTVDVDWFYENVATCSIKLVQALLTQKGAPNRHPTEAQAAVLVERGFVMWLIDWDRDTRLSRMGEDEVRRVKAAEQKETEEEDEFDLEGYREQMERPTRRRTKRSTTKG